MQMPLTMDSRLSRFSRRLPELLAHPYLLFALVALVVWLPQGFNIGPVNDGWFNIGGPWLRMDASRVFGNIPIRIGVALRSGDYIGIQVMILTLLSLHAALFYEIVRRLLPDRDVIAVAAGLIGLFHAADRSYFWVGAMGLQFSLATALGSALCAILYLDSRRGRYLAATVALQLVSAFTYPAFLPLIVGVPIGAWLLRWIEGARPQASYQLKVAASAIVMGSMYWYQLSLGEGRNSKVVDVHVAAAVSGFGWAIHHLFDSVPAMFSDGAIELLPILVVVFLAYPAAARAVQRNAPMQAGTAQDLLHFALTVVGLLVLALLSFLPYSISTVRYDAVRTMLACGMFAYTALVVISVALLERRVPKAVLILLMMGLAGYTVLVGYHQRDAWVRSYRAEERLLAGVAASVPHPYPGTVILVHLHDPAQADGLKGFYNRQRTLSLALDKMYGDPTLIGGFWGFDDDQVNLGADGLRMRGFHDSEGRLHRYSSLLVLDYQADGRAKILDAAWLRRQVGTGVTAAASYSPRFGDEPGADAIMCSMLEADLRPQYCR